LITDKPTDTEKISKSIEKKHSQHTRITCVLI